MTIFGERLPGTVDIELTRYLERAGVRKEREAVTRQEGDDQEHQAMESILDALEKQRIQVHGVANGKMARIDTPTWTIITYMKPDSDEIIVASYKSLLGVRNDHSDHIDFSQHEAMVFLHLDRDLPLALDTDTSHFSEIKTFIGFESHFMARDYSQPMAELCRQELERRMTPVIIPAQNP